MDSYAYNPNNEGHLYINSQQLEDDLKRIEVEREHMYKCGCEIAMEMRKDGVEYNCHDCLLPCIDEEEKKYFLEAEEMEKRIAWN